MTCCFSNLNLTYRRYRSFIDQIGDRYRVWVDYLIKTISPVCGNFFGSVIILSKQQNFERKKFTQQKSDKLTPNSVFMSQVLFRDNGEKFTPVHSLFIYKQTQRSEFNDNEEHDDKLI
jgi:hypothetical protein